MPFTITYSELKSLSQDDVDLNSVSQTGDAILTGGVNSITERKKLLVKFEITALEYETPINIAGAAIYVNWALFMPTGTPLITVDQAPTTGFYIQVTDLMTPATEFVGLNMPFYSAGDASIESCRNLTCKFYWYSEYEFGFEFEYYNVSDENGYLSNLIKNNEWKFLAESWEYQNTNIIESTVYNQSKDLRAFIHIYNPPATIDDEAVTESQEIVIYQGQINKHSSTVEVWSAESGEQITSLNTIIDQDLFIRFYCESNTIDKFYVKIVRMQNDQTLDLVSNYELVEILIADLDVTRNDYDGSYDLAFTMSADYVVTGGKYRLMVVAYDQDGSGSNDQGTSPQYSATDIVPYCDSNCPVTEELPTYPVITASLFDIQNEYTGNFLTCCIEERIKSRLTFDYSDDRWKNNIDCRRGLLSGETLTSNDIRKYLTNIGVEIYHEYTDSGLGGTVRNTLDIKNIQRIATNTYQSNDSNLTFNFTAGEVLELEYDFRNRNDAQLPALATFLNNVAYLPILGDQYWGGKEIHIKWTLTFYYHDFPNPFIDNIYVIQKMVVKDYSDDITITPNPADFFCPDDEFCMTGVLDVVDPENYNLINTWQINGGTGVTESENYTPDELAQETSSVFSSQDVDFTDGDAQFCVDASNLFINTTYKFSAMAKLK